MLSETPSRRQGYSPGLTRRPYGAPALSAGGGSEFTAGFEEARAAKGITLTPPPPKSPRMYGSAERMQATWLTGFRTVQDTAVNVAGLGPLIDRYLAFQSRGRPHDAFDGMASDEYPGSRRIREAPPLHMS